MPLKQHAANATDLHNMKQRYHAPPQTRILVVYTDYFVLRRVRVIDGIKIFATQLILDGSRTAYYF